MVVQLDSTTYEQRTQEIAKELIAQTREKRSLWSKLGDQMRLDDKLLDFAMANPGLRVQLFHFIDTLPALQSNAEIAHHLQQYLGDESVELPSSLKGILNFTDYNSLPAKVAAETISKAVQTLAFKYISGETVPQVIKTVERLRKEKMGFTIDLLGEAVITESEAKAYLDSYLDLMEKLATESKKWSNVAQIDTAGDENLSKVQVSVKLTAFYSQFDPIDPQGSKEKVCTLIRILLRRAQELGVAIHFDMEQYVYKDLTLSILRELLLEEEFRNRSDIGVTLQAYLRDSKQDLHDLISWAKQRGTPITIRLVKGAYWDQETIKSEQNHWPQPVYNQKSATDVNYEEMTQLLLENHQYLYAAIGSHNVRSQARAIAIAETLKVPSRAFEMQVLYGMGDQLAKALVKTGHRVRVYAPYGNLLPGMAYLIRRLLENTANSSFLRQNLEERPIEDLIAPPTLSGNTERIAQKESFVNVPDTDYSREVLRDKAEKALAKVKDSLDKTYLPLINGEYVQTDVIVESVNPSKSSEVVGQIGLISVSQAEQALNAAREAFKDWKKTPATERARIIRKAGDLMEERRHELSCLLYTSPSPRDQ